MKQTATTRYDRVKPSPGRVDEALIGAVAGGDREAFRLLYEQAAPAVLGFALSLLRSREDAEDAMQETFVRIRTAAAQYTAAGKPMAWILTIARNVCMTHFRQQTHHVPLEEGDGELSDGFAAVRNLENRLVLETAMKALSEQERQIVMLHAQSGLKHREIGALLGIPVGTVLSKYNRSMSKLRRQLEGKHEVEQ